MDTRQLAALCAVVERGSFSQAAESLGAGREVQLTWDPRHTFVVAAEDGALAM